MKRTINKVTVLGSGIMGSRIAAHFANIGVKVRLMDIAPFDLTEDEQKKGLSLDDPRVKMRIVTQSWQNTLKSKPASLYTESFASRVELGNFKDNMKDIGDSDWVIEVVVENLKIKKQVYDEVEKYRKKGTLVTSNTSGIPIHLMLDGRSEDFAKNFAGTHFFNPPRYLKLLEIIPTPKTDPEVTEFLMEYGSKYLGKTTVLAKDTPAFIANRVGIFGIMKVVDTMQKLGLNVDEVDRLTGPIVGRAKSATFRTSDVVGLDTLVKVANGLYEGLPNDEQREVFKLPPQVNEMIERKWLGDKTGQGFYKKTKNDKGQTEILTLDLETMEYREKQRPKFATLEQTKPIENLNERLPILLSGKDKAGEFYRHSFYGLFQYVSNRIPEVADELYKIDDAIKTGFGWKQGPFESWDVLGVKKTVAKMEELGYKPNQWVYDMLEAGKDSFYKSEGGRRLYYDIPSKSYKAIPGTEEFILLDTLRSTNKVWGNTDATILDLGDGILNLEFHSKMNTMGAGVIEGINKAISLAEESYRGLVIANEGENFSAGANLGMLFMYAIEQEFDEVDFMVRQFQQTMMRVRYSSIPVVAAPHGLTLGGGCELTMHADQVVAAAETYIGLVEVGVGLLPGGGGTKELTLRVSESLEAGDVEYNALQNAFMNIATAKVATSAYEALDMNILRKKDRIVVSRDRQIAEAKAAAIALADAGYVQPIQRTDIKVLGKGGLALFLAGVHGMRAGNYISDHDKKIAEKIAYVMCGGDLSYPQEVSEQYLLDLEREAFVSLCAERKTLERIQSIIQGGKPLRN